MNLRTSHKFGVSLVRCNVTVSLGKSVRTSLIKCHVMSILQQDCGIARTLTPGSQAQQLTCHGAQHVVLDLSCLGYRICTRQRKNALRARVLSSVRVQGA